MSGQTGFWYPSMDVDEIVSSIRGWGLEITNAQIQAPTAEVVQAIYSLFLSQITGLTADTLEEPAMRALGVVEVNQELYANALNMHLLLHHIQRIAMAARVQDFSMKDLVAPETQRTRLILSAFVNFIRFAEEREVFLKELRDKSLRTIEERDRMKQQVEELRAAIEKQKLEAEKSRPQCSALKQENEELRKGLLDTKGDLNKVVDEVAELRDKKKALSRQKEQLVQELARVEDANIDTKGRIVRSPERIKRDISAFRDKAQEDRKIVAAHEGKSRDLEAKLEALSVFEEDIKKCIVDLKAIQSEQEQLEEAEKTSSALNAELERRSVQRDELRASSERLKRQLVNANEKFNRVSQSAQERKVKSQQAIERLKREYAQMSEERRINDKNVEETNKEANEIERKMMEHMKKSEAELNELLAEYWNLRHRTEVYMETLADKLGMEVPHS